MKTSKLIPLLLVSTALALGGCPKPAAEQPAAGEKPGQAEGRTTEQHGEQAEKGEADEKREGGEAGESTVKLTGEALEHAGIRTAAVAERPLGLDFTTTGEVVANPDREARVTPRTAGRVVQLLKSVGDRVQAGEPLATLESVELGQAEADYLEAQARHRLARRVLDRQRQLFRKDLAAQKEVQAAENDAELAQIALEKAKNKLELFGLTPARIASLASSRRIDPRIPLLAPTRGVVTSKHATLGEVLQPDAVEPAFSLTDTSTLWVNAAVYEKDLARVHEGQLATITTNAYGGMALEGRVARIATALDPTARTAHARVVVANPTGRLRPEMFVKVQLRVGTRQALAIPAAAVLQDKDLRFAFVEAAEGTYERRRLTLGTKAGGYFPVLDGVEAGEKVVVAGGFTLKSELLKESFGEEE